MMKYVYVHNIKVPSYGLIVIFGVMICNLISLWITKKKQIDLASFLKVEMIGTLGSIVGARFLAVISHVLQWKLAGDSIDNIFTSSYYYFGGLAGFFLALNIYMRKKQIDLELYIHNFLFVVPLLHFFWKIGCFMGGCCYGIPYGGFGAVVFPKDVNVLSGTMVFPIQLIEAVGVLVISVWIFVNKDNQQISLVGLFLLLYGIERLGLEFLRYHTNSVAFIIGSLCAAACAAVGIVFISNRRRNT